MTFLINFNKYHEKFISFIIFNVFETGDIINGIAL